jgi:signal transduction histidine kinase
VLILAASYLLLFETGSAISSLVPILIAVALASNLLLSYISASLLLRPYFGGIIICADTAWIIWGLSQQGSFGPDIFLLYFFVLFLAAIGENMVLIITAAVVLSAADLIFLVPVRQQASFWEFWHSPSLVRVPFIFSVALFYAYFADKVKRERRHALLEKELAERMTKVVHAQTKGLREQAEGLRVSYDEIERIKRAKDEFLAVFSHELRTPLHIIKSYLNMMQEGAYGPLGDGQMQALAKVEKTTDDLFGMITTLIHLAEISVGRRIQKARFELREVCYPLADRYRLLAQEKNLVFKEDLLHEDSVGETDKEKLACLLSHLLDNAFKFTGKGEILFRAKYEPDRDRFRFEVRDTGIGFSKEIIPNLTEAFKQRDMSQTRIHGGLGLGLNLVKKYTELLDGTLHISSKEGRGSSFVVEIPAHLNGNRVELKVGGWAEGSKPNGGSMVQQMEASQESVPSSERKKSRRFSLSLSPVITLPKWWWRAINSTSP